MGFFDRFFGKRLPSTPPEPPPPPDLSEANLRRVLGDVNVKHAWGLAITAVATSQPGRDQVGGIPANIGSDIWPACEQCLCPLTFIAQVAVGPDEAIAYPERGSIAIFLCNSEPPTTDELCITADGVGAVAFFMVDTPTALPMFSAEQISKIDAMHVRGLEIDDGASKKGYAPFLLRGSGGFHARPLLEHAFRVERTQVLSTRADPHDEAAWVLWLAQTQANDVAIDIHAFPDWVQGPHEHTCSCGADMELVIQFDSFDDAINLGDAGRAYVFACVKRCGPKSFLVRWDCC